VARIHLREVFFFMVYAYDIAYDFPYLAPQKPVQDFLSFFPFEEIV
jgi:hypothetical protein